MPNLDPPPPLTQHHELRGRSGILPASSNQANPSHASLARPISDSSTTRFINLPAEELDDDANDPYQPGSDDEGSSENEDSYISNAEVWLFDLTFQDYNANTFQVADCLPRVSRKKQERRAAAQAKMIVGTGKRKKAPSKTSRTSKRRRHSDDTGANSSTNPQPEPAVQSNENYSQPKAKTVAVRTTYGSETSPTC